MNPILIGLLVGAGLVAGWWITTWINQFMTWLERRR